MPDVLIRNLDDELLRDLRAAAKAHGRSLQGEIHHILRSASVRRMAETRKVSTRWLARLRGTAQSDSAQLIRDDRDAR